MVVAAKSETKKLVQRVVKTYLAQLYGMSLTYKEISELFRECVCGVLGLQTRGCFDAKVVSRVQDALRPEFETKTDCTIERRQALLEACIHGLEMTRRRLEDAEQCKSFVQ